MAKQDYIELMKLEVLEKHKEYLNEKFKLDTMPKGKIPGKELQSLKMKKAEKNWQESLFNLK